MFKGGSNIFIKLPFTLRCLIEENRPDISNLCSRQHWTRARDISPVGRDFSCYSLLFAFILRSLQSFAKKQWCSSYVFGSNRSSTVKSINESLRKTAINSFAATSSLLCTSASYDHIFRFTNCEKERNRWTSDKCLVRQVVMTNSKKTL